MIIIINIPSYYWDSLVKNLRLWCSFTRATCTTAAACGPWRSFCFRLYLAAWSGLILLSRHRVGSPWPARRLILYIVYRCSCLGRLHFWKKTHKNMIQCTCRVKHDFEPTKSSYTVWGTSKNIIIANLNSSTRNVT